MLTEGEIRKNIPDILRANGYPATKKEIVNAIPYLYRLDEKDDLAKCNGMNEAKYIQRVRNIVSNANHRDQYRNNYIEFEEGFAIVKTNSSKERWLFTLPIKHTAHIKPIITTKRKLSNRGRHFNWKEIQKSRDKDGEAGEKYVFEEEKKWVEENYPSEINRVEWTSKKKGKDGGDGLGYDVRSICHDNPSKDLLIEVKTTKDKNPNKPFQMSKKELDVFKSNESKNECLVLYRLYNPNDDMSRFDKIVFTQSEVVNEFNREPFMYNMVKKQEERYEVPY